MISWVSFATYTTGFAYYKFSWTSGSGVNAGGFYSSSKVPTQKLKIFRDSIDDYAYLYIANGGQHPRVDIPSTINETVFSAAASLTTWNTDSYDAMQTLRNNMGLFIDGTLTCAPKLQAICAANVMPRKSYFINFQAPDTTTYASGALEAGYLGEDGVLVSWNRIKFSGQPWEDLLPYGTHPNQDPLKGFVTQTSAGVKKTAFSTSGNGFSASQRSCIYDDNGRTATFHWGIPNGWYRVKVTIGRPGRNDGSRSRIEIEGHLMHDARVPNGESLDLEREIELTDCDLTISFAQYDQYTFLSRMEIIPFTKTGAPPVCAPLGVLLPPASPFPSPPPADGANRAGSSTVGVAVGVTFAILIVLGAVVAVLFVMRARGKGPLSGKYQPVSGQSSTPYSEF